MKCKLAMALSLLCASTAQATSVFINEIHYDNVGGDVGEFFEIAAPIGTDLSGWSVMLYNGSNGTAYNTLDLSSGTLVEDAGFSFLAVSLPANGLQNGSPDGLALIDNNDNVIQFLSYEGSFTATSGVATGMTSVDIGVSEPNNTVVGFSLQLSGMGSEYSDFSWAMPADQTPGAANNNQTFDGFTASLDLVINEFLADPAGDLTGDANGDGTRNATQDEFVEIVNNGETNADLSGVELGDAVFAARHVFPEGTIVEPGCAILVFGGGSPTGEFGESLVQTASSGGLGLNNGGDSVTLTNGDETITLEYGSEGGNNQSLTRNPDITGEFAQHSSIDAAQGALFSPGTKLDGSVFCSEDVIEEVNIVINEVHADPAGDLTGDANGDGIRNATQDEFVEIVNVGEAPANLSGWEIADGVATRHIFPEGSMVAPGCSVVVFGGGTPTGDFGGALMQVSSGGSLGLNNGGDSVTVSSGDNSQTFEYGSEGGNNQSLTRNPDITGEFAQHSGINGAQGALFSPGTKLDGASFSGCSVTDIAPTVIDITPADGATDVAADTTISITFSEEVTVSEWPALSCTVSGSVALSGDVSGTSFTLTPDANLNSNETCTFTLPASSVADTDGTADSLAEDFESAFTTAELLSCEAPSAEMIDFIHDVQGSGDASPLVGQTVTVEGVVTQVLMGTSGFYMQEEDADMDADPSTSEGVFVFYASEAPLPAVNSVVRVVGEATEFFEETQIIAAQAPVVCGEEEFTPTIISLPFASAAEPETTEGMYVSFDSPLTVSDNFNLGRFGDVTLSNGRLFNPTNLHAPLSPEALALAAQNALNRITLTDDDSSQNRDPIVFPTGGLSASNTLRGGDTVSQLEGALNYGFGAYRIVPAVEPTFVQSNPREATPSLTRGNLTVASLNVLNLFNGDGQGGDFPTPRGADSIEEYDRQLVKTVNALNAMDADIIGLMEIENDGFGPLSTIAQLTDELNAIAGDGVYAFIDANNGNPVGTDAIAVGFLYKPATVTPVGDTQLNFDDIFNRPPTAQVFALDNGEEIAVVVNHFKSKSCRNSSGADDDQGDGQGCYNDQRTKQAQSLANWLSSNDALSSQTNVLIIGDLNAYAKEDPIVALETAGYTNVIEAYQGAEAYSYTFFGEVGYLDHALATDSLLAKATDAIEWHINADEPRILDYNLEFKSPQQQIDLYSEDVFRMSDHDPVLVSFNLQPDVLVGDLDGDGDVDFADIVALSRSIRSGNATDLSNDFNEDGVVDTLDVRVLRTMCTRTRCSTR